MAKHKQKRSAFERNSAKVKRSRKEDLYLLSLEMVIRRKVDEHNFYVEATGTAESIQSWNDQAFGGDLNQKRAFEVIMSNFVLQFHYEADAVKETHCDLRTIKGRKFEGRLFEYIILLLLIERSWRMSDIITIIE
jgi:hypothetical protein